MFKRTEGDYTKLDANEKKVYLDSFAGNEAAAQEYWEKMKAGTAGQNVPGAPKGG